MKKKRNPLKDMMGLFEGKVDRSSTDLVRDIREESEARLERLKSGIQRKQKRKD